MLVMGLDIATSTGVCLMDTRKPSSEWRCYAIEAEGHSPEDKAGDFAIALAGELNKRYPDFVAIEQPQRSVTRYARKGEEDATGSAPLETTINPAVLLLGTLAGAAVGVLETLGVPWGTIHPATWRKAYYHKGYRPPVDWKQSAVDMANLQKIPLPLTKRHARDCAEAVGIAAAWSRCTYIPERHQRAFMDLRTGQPA